MITELPARIDSLLVGASVLERSREMLDPCRSRGVEGCLLWFGYAIDDATCLVTTCVRPVQMSYMTAYAISAEAMRDVRRQVRPHKLLLLVQVHSHPERAYFSDWDEEHALNGRGGALNLVVPDYGNVRWLDMERFCMAERSDTGAWVTWSVEDWKRFAIVPDAIFARSMS